MTTNINDVNDPKFQAMDINFIVQMEPDKLIIETSSQKDELQYVGEIPANPFIDFEDIKELL
jgi:flagellar basal body rod protein FlgB